MRIEFNEIRHFCGAKHLDCWGNQLSDDVLEQMEEELEELDDDDESGVAVVLYLSDEQLCYAYEQAVGKFRADWHAPSYPERATKALNFLHKQRFELTHTYVNPNSDNVVHMFVRPGSEQLTTDWY